MNAETILERRARCDHAGSGNGPCLRCGASPRRKWLELAAQWMRTASQAVVRAEACADRANAESEADALAAHLEDLRDRQLRLRQLIVLADGFDYYRERERISLRRARLTTLRKVRERLERPREPEPVWRGTFGARCEEAAT